MAPLRYRWVILAVGAAAQLSFATVFFGLPVLAPALQARYHLSLGDVGIVLGAVNFGTIVTVLPWGMLADRIGERAVIAIGIGGCGLTIAATATFQSYAGLLITTTVAGLLGASVLAATGRAVMAWFPFEQRGFALAVRQTATPVGGALAAAVLPALVDAGGIRLGLLTIAGTCCVAAVACAIALRPNPVSRAAAPADAPHPFRDRRLWSLSAGSGLLIVTQSAILGFMVVFLHERRGFALAEAGAILAITNALGAVMRLAAGIRSDRVGHRIGPLITLAAALTTATALSTALIGAPSAVLIPALVLAGALSLSWNSLSFTATAELAGEARAGAALGFQQTALSIAIVVGPVAFGNLVDHTTWTVGFVGASAAALVGTALLRRLRHAL